MHKLKEYILSFSFFYFILYLTLIPFIYFSFSYDLNSNLSDIDIENKSLYYDNLVDFFLYKDDLNEYFSQKEKLHYIEVRSIYNFLFLFFLIFSLILYFNKNNLNFKRYSRYSLISLLILPIIISINFTYFWDNIFHNILFDNNLWVMTQEDLSYYIFNHDFFKYIILEFFLLNLIIHLSIIYKYKLTKLIRNARTKNK